MSSATTIDPAAAVQVGRGEYNIQTANLNLWYGKFQALKNVTVNIKRGIITSLIGPSGCGKTTLLRCFNRINERYGNVTTTGEVRVLSKNIYDPDVSLTQLRRTEIGRASCRERVSSTVVAARFTKKTST